jgi:hypothetical protein
MQRKYVLIQQCAEGRYGKAEAYSQILNGEGMKQWIEPAVPLLLNDIWLIWSKLQTTLEMQ